MVYGSCHFYRATSATMVVLNCVIRSTMYSCYTLKSVDASKNDSQSQKLDGTKIHLVPTLSEVGGDASDGSHRVVARIVIAVL